VPQLRGVVVEAKPACRPKELLVAVLLPGAQPPFPPEITLKLARPLSGKPDSEAEFQWAGAPTTFAKTPFMLTMEVETAKIDGLKTSSCYVGPPRKAAGKKK
jgi:hypothetical protein